jgi:hypothetical protein
MNSTARRRREGELRFAPRVRKDRFLGRAVATTGRCGNPSWKLARRAGNPYCPRPLAWGAFRKPSNQPDH